MTENQEPGLAAPSSVKTRRIQLYSKDKTHCGYITEKTN